ncbi:hypothetical protein SVIOM342S_10109 [Streptomyces violaceorubidus]
MTSRAGRDETLPPQLRHVPFRPLVLPLAVRVLLNGPSPHSRFRPLEPAVPEETDRDCYGSGHRRNPVSGQPRAPEASITQPPAEEPRATPTASPVLTGLCPR